MSFFAPGTPLADIQRFEQNWLNSQQPDMSTMVAEEYPPPSAQPFNPFSSIRQRLSAPMQRGIGQIGPYGMGMGGYGGGGGGFFPPQMMGGYGGGGFFPPQMMGGYGGFGGGFPPQMMGGYGGFGGGFPPQMMGGYGGFGGGFPPQMMGGYGGFGGGFPPQMMGGYGGFGGGFGGYPQQMMGGYGDFQQQGPVGMSKQFFEALSTPAQSSPQMSMDMAYRGPARTPEQTMIANQTRRMLEQQRMGMQQQAMAQQPTMQQPVSYSDYQNSINTQAQRNPGVAELARMAGFQPMSQNTFNQTSQTSQYSLGAGNAFAPPTPAGGSQQPGQQGPRQGLF